jgi:hypothetical protein
LAVVEGASFAKIGESFVPIGRFDGPVEDPEHFLGAIDYYIDGQMISSIPYWDGVNYLWNFVVQGLEKIAAGQEWSTSWPDQPIKLKFTPLPMDDLVRVERWGTSDPDVRALAQRAQLMEALLPAAGEFFEVYARLGGGDWASKVQTPIRDLQSRPSAAT